MSKNDLVAQIFGIVVFGIIILALFGYAILYYISVKLFPLFVIGYILSGIAAIGCGVMIYINRDDEPGLFSILTGVSVLIFIISIGGANITGSLIQEIPATEEGRASLDAWNDLWFIIGIPTYVQETFQTALDQQIEEICKLNDEQVCQMTKDTVEMYKDTQELSDWINKGGKLIDFVEKHKV